MDNENIQNKAPENLDSVGIPETVAPEKTEEATVAEAAPAPEADMAELSDEIPEMIEDEVPQIPPGKEFGDGKHTDVMVEMFRHPALTSTSTNVGEFETHLRKFMSSIPRDSDDNPKFSSPEQESMFLLLQGMMEVMAPQYNVSKPYPYATSQAISECNPEEFSVGTRRVNDVFVAAKSSKNASAILRQVRSKRNSGNEITLYLPATGIYVTFAAPSELDFCNYEVELAMKTSSIGYSTYGMMLSTTSGAYLRHMLDFAMGFAVSTTLDCGDMSIAQALQYNVESPDYGILLLGPLIAKFPGGIPWNLYNPETGLVEETTLNLFRIIRTFNDRLTDEQRQHMVKYTKAFSVTQDVLKEYRKATRVNNKERYVDQTYGIAIYFKSCTLDEYFESVEEWIQATEHSTAKALGQYATEVERARHTATVIETHRLTRYLHKIAAVATLNENLDDDEINDDPEEIKKVLVELSSDRMFVKRFEEAVAEFEETGRRTGYGYMPRGKDPKAEAKGPMRGFVPLSPDRIFFTLSRVVYEVQRTIAQAYANAG